jgi:hypothetical protein
MHRSDGSPAVRTGNLSASLLDAIEEAYQEAVQSVSILNDIQQCQNSQSYESFGTFVGIKP